MQSLLFNLMGKIGKKFIMIYGNERKIYRNYKTNKINGKYKKLLNSGACRIRTINYTQYASIATKQTQDIVQYFP